jgi:hypothetical protein
MPATGRSTGRYRRPVQVADASQRPFHRPHRRPLPTAATDGLCQWLLVRQGRLTTPADDGSATAPGNGARRPLLRATVYKSTDGISSRWTDEPSGVPSRRCALSEITFLASIPFSFPLTGFEMGLARHRRRALNRVCAAGNRATNGAIQEDALESRIAARSRDRRLGRRSRDACLYWSYGTHARSCCNLRQRAASPSG